MELSAETSISLILLGVSLFYFFLQPKKVNYFYGYRTPKSMKSKEHWKVANKMAAKYMLVLSLFDAILGFMVADILEFYFLNIFLVLLVLEFAILFYLVEKKLGEIDSMEADLDHQE